MAKARKIQKRLRAVGNIRTVTKTMEMVASMRFKRSHDRAVSARPYTDRLADLVGDILGRRDESALRHPMLIEHPTVKRDVLIVLTSNSGMCGAYNAAVLSVAIERLGLLDKEGYDVKLWVAGKRGVRNLRFRGYEVDRVLADFDHRPDYSRVSDLARELLAMFLGGRLGGLEAAYTQFLSSGRQVPVIAQLLPLTYTPPPPRTPGAPELAPYEFRPSQQEILDELLPATLRLRLYQCFLDAAVAEQIARVRAMGAATENADEMLHDLTVRYNRTRQAQITTELAEIVGGSTQTE